MACLFHHASERFSSDFCFWKHDLHACKQQSVRENAIADEPAPPKNQRSAGLIPNYTSGTAFHFIRVPMSACCFMIGDFPGLLQFCDTQKTCIEPNLKGRFNRNVERTDNCDVFFCGEH